MALVLESSLLVALRSHAERRWPNECCGVLLGESERVSELAVCENVAFDSDRRFAIDPLALLRIERDADARGLRVLGFYHSHPDNTARPSETDRLAAWPGYSYIIIAVDRGTAGDITSWRLDADTATFRPEAILEPALAE